MKIVHFKNERAMRGSRLTVPALASLGDKTPANYLPGRLNAQFPAKLFQQVSESAANLIDALNQAPPRVFNRQHKEAVRGNAERLLHVLIEFLNLCGSVKSDEWDKIVRNPDANQADPKFLRQAISVAERHLSDFEFGTEMMAKEMAISRRQLFRRFKKMAGCTPNIFLRTLRLKRAAQLLSESRMTITGITHAVGFSDLKYFRAVFRKQFGMLPTEYARESIHQEGGKRADKVTNRGTTFVACHEGVVVRGTSLKLWVDELVTGLSL